MVAEMSVLLSGDDVHNTCVFIGECVFLYYASFEFVIAAMCVLRIIT